jgi:hypothetical protein
MRPVCSISSLVLFPYLLSGCSFLLGTVKPVEEKSKNYTAIDLSKNNTDWVKLESKQNPNSNPSKSSEIAESGGADIAFQSKSDGSTISIDSACRTYSPQNRDLRHLTDQLLLGVKEITTPSEKTLTVAGGPALETTLLGKVENQRVKLRTIVLQRKNCVFDFMLIARPESFNRSEADFSQFVNSFHLK